MRQRLLQTCIYAYNTWDVQKLNAKSNLPEHTVQRGKVDERRGGGVEGARTGINTMSLYLQSVGG